MPASDTVAAVPGAATAAASYRYWTDELVRFADLDLLGHVNNKAFTVYAESGRAAFLQQTGLWLPGATPQTVIARVEIDYLRELNYPCALKIGVRVLKLGRSSFTLGLGIFDGDSCVAVVVTVLVRIDSVTHETLPLSANERERLQPYFVHAG
jgi:acyl-CoA thioester hydrolase